MPLLCAEIVPLLVMPPPALGLPKTAMLVPAKTPIPVVETI
jgi:hypothetical protein